MWFRRKKVRQPVQWVAPIVRFVGEQDGIPERNLKELFSDVFRKYASVERAYLARVNYDDGTGLHVVLCIAAPTNNQLNKAITEIFWQTFSTKEHLDVLFLRDAEQESELANVCRAFYEVRSKGA